MREISTRARSRRAASSHSAMHGQQPSRVHTAASLAQCRAACACWLCSVLSTPRRPPTACYQDSSAQRRRRSDCGSLSVRSRRRRSSAREPWLRRARCSPTTRRRRTGSSATRCRGSRPTRSRRCATGPSGPAGCTRSRHVRLSLAAPCLIHLWQPAPACRFTRRCRPQGCRPTSRRCSSAVSTAPTRSRATPRTVAPTTTRCAGRSCLCSVSAVAMLVLRVLRLQRLLLTFCLCGAGLVVARVAQGVRAHEGAAVPAPGARHLRVPAQQQLGRVGLRRRLLVELLQDLQELHH